LKGRYRLAILLKKGDKVQVIAGKDKGKKGKILRVDRENNAVIVEGVNLRKKHSKASQKNPQGGIIQSEGPLNISNVQLLCSSCGELTRPLVKISDKERIRACRKCEAQI
jgi:large subunit ribosomal protein L24